MRLQDRMAPRWSQGPGGGRVASLPANRRSACCPISRAVFPSSY